MAAQSCIHELCSDPNSVSDLANAALDGIANTELTTDFPRIWTLVPKMERRAARSYSQLVPAGQLGDDVLCDAIAEILLFRIATHVDKRQDCDRGLVRQREGFARLRHPR